MPKSKRLSIAELKQCTNQGVMSLASGNVRKAADLFRRAAVGAPTVWTKERCHYFLYYTSLLGRAVIASKKDLDCLHRIKHNEEEPVFFRSEAAFVHGFCMWNNGDWETATESYRQCIGLIKAAGQDERNKTVVLLSLNSQGRMVVSRTVTVGEFLDDIVLRFNVVRMLSSRSSLSTLSPSFFSAVVSTVCGWLFDVLVKAATIF